MAANLAAFARWAIYPRLLRDVTAGHTRADALAGAAFAHPVLLAPVAFQSLAHAGGELETARAAAATDSCLVPARCRRCTLEDVARAAGPQRWFQLYFQPRRDDTLDLVRARRGGRLRGHRASRSTRRSRRASLRALRAGFRMPADCVAANLRVPRGRPPPNWRRRQPHLPGR